MQPVDIFLGIEPKEYQLNFIFHLTESNHFIIELDIAKMVLFIRCKFNIICSSNITKSFFPLFKKLIIYDLIVLEIYLDGFFYMP